jgi:hypothetical protein
MKVLIQLFGKIPMKQASFMVNAKSAFATMMVALLFTSPVQADLILTATYTDPTQTGPLSFGLAALPVIHS